MRVIVITSPASVKDESKIIHALFESGLECLHVRKPDLEIAQMEEYIQAIPSQWHARLMLHHQYTLALQFNTMGIHVSSEKRKTMEKEQLNHWKQASFRLSTSIHFPNEYMEVRDQYDYTFASPVFESISKKGYVPQVNWLEEVNALTKASCSVIALGGITPEKVKAIQATNFDGMALLGSIWNNVEQAVSTLQQCRKNVPV